MSVKNALVIISFFVSIFFQDLKALAQNNDNQAADGQSLASHSIRLDVKVQQLAGIETSILEPSKYQTEFTAYGSALNIQPLINLHYRYQLAQTEYSSAKAKYLNSGQNISRQQNLFRHGVASKRSLQGQQSQFQVDKAAANATYVQGKAIVDEALLFWGRTLTEWALSENSGQLSGFLSGQQTLLKITLPVNKHLADGIQTIYVEPSGDRGKAAKAVLIAEAPQVDTTIQGESYFFKTGNASINPGMRIAAWIPEHDQRQIGVMIPKSALIWHMDQSYVYIKTDQQTFSRRKIERLTLTPEGYFIANELKPGEQLVTAGGQLLLSEEFRVQIPDEDKD